MAAYAALVSLVNNIEQIQSHTRFPICFDQTQSEALLDKVNILIDFLENYNYRGAGKEMEDLESRIRDAAYAAEDIIETHVVDKIEAHSKSSKEENVNVAPLTRLQDVEKVEDMESIKEEAINLKDKKETQHLHPTSPIIGPSTSTVSAGHKYSGSGEEMKDLESRITDDIIKTHVVDKIEAQSKNPIVPAYAELDLPENQTLSCLLGKEKLKEDMESMKLKDKNETEDPRTSKSVTINRSENEMRTVKNPTLSCLEKVMEDMHSIKEAAMKLKDRNETRAMHPTTPIISPSISYVLAGKNTTVGFDDELKRIMELLLSSHSSRQVIPIVGMGGIGKTTLAKTAYDKFKGGKHFDFCAWVTISQEYDLKKIVLGLLTNESSQMRGNAIKEEQTNCQMSGNELGEKLHKKLCKRRYLILLDDMWNVEAWEMVMRFLPDNKNGSRIIVTTRESSVSTSFGSSSLEMSFLDENQSWNLFCEKVFASKSCPRELEEVGRKIAINCKGLPLSIVVIGGLLAKSERTKAYWDDIARDMKTRMSLEDDGQCMKILSLSYKNLPIHLKPCFLYTGAFPEDKEIQASMLIKLWVAEGFLKSESSKGLEELAETYLNDLISRNLILIHERKINGKVKYCMIHDLMRDLCLKIVKNEKFMYVSNKCIRDKMVIGSHRRISSHISSSPQVLKSGSMPQTRTLICDLDQVSQLQNFRLLRVLDCTETERKVNNYTLDDTLMLVNSRLIALSIATIPSSICLSWNLRILINQLYVKMVAPLEIWEMTELRNVEFRGGLYLPDPPPSQQQECDVTMKSLQTLKKITNFKLSDEVVKRIPNIKELEISYEFIGTELEDMGLEKLCLLKNLESLVLVFKPQTDSAHLSNLTFPISLKKLTLSECGLQREEMSKIASLPLLQELKLRYNSFKGHRWELDEEEFTCLKYLEIMLCTGLVRWTAEDKNFPCLEHLLLVGLDELEIPSGIGDIPTLEKIALGWCGKSVVKSAKNILDEQVSQGNQSLKVFVRGENDAEIQSLANDNFIVYKRNH